MTKLTNTVRDEIIEELMVHTFGERLQKVVDAQREFALKLYQDVWGMEDIKRMNALPDGWMKTYRDIGVQFGTSGHRYESLNFNGNNLGGKAHEYLPKKPDQVYYRQPYGGSDCRKVYDEDHALSLEWFSLDKEAEDLGEEIQQKFHVAKSAVYSCSTAKSLLKAWPEIKPFVPDYALASQSTAIALPTAELNQKFNLPKVA